MKGYKSVPLIYQMEATECGAASLSMIFSYYGNYLPLEKMRIEVGVSKDGCSAANMMRAAKRHGLHCKAYSKEPASLKELKMPCIIHWNFDHFVVLEGFKRDHVYLCDPAVGRRKITEKELDDSFSGVVLTFEPTETFQKVPRKNTLFSFVKERLKGQFGILFKLIYVGLLLVFPGLVLPVLSQVFMDDILGNGYSDWLVRLLVFMGLTVLLKAGLTYYRHCLLQALRHKLIVISGYQFVRHLFRLPAFFFDQRHAGDISSRLEDNTEVSEFLAGDLGETALNLLVALFYLILLIFYSIELTLIGLLSIAANIGTMIYSMHRIGDSVLKLSMDSGKLSGVVCAGINISDTIKAAGAERAYTSRILGYQAKVSSQEQELNRTQTIINAIPDTIGKLSDVLILLFGGILVIRGELTIGMLVAFSSLFSSFSEPVEELVGFFKSLKTLKANLVRVEDVVKYEEDPIFTEKMGSRESQGKEKLKGTVELDYVSFGYTPYKPPLISEFTLKVLQGRSVALVGASGCGKSTVSKLVGGLYQPWEGEIIFDGIPAKKLTKEVRNASIATVSQAITLFSGTVRDNLRLWNPAISDEAIEKAAKDACIHDVIVQKPGGYNFHLEESGANLSGGQRQRLEIARALATNPRILILDEATSALDPIVEKRVLDNIKARGCTCIVVAHRLSAIRDCDKIVVIKQGRIIEQGTHEYLMKEGKYYPDFVKTI